MTASAILKLRMHLKLTQIEFARRLGIHQAQVSRLESGHRTAKGPLLKLLNQMKGLS